MRKDKAFTLVELMVSVAIFMIALYALTSSLINSTGMFGHAASLVGSIQPLRAAMSRMDSDYRQSSGHLSGSNSRKLIIDGIIYEYISGKLKRTKGADAFYLTDENELKGFTIQYLGPKLIGVAMTAKSGRVYKYEISARN